MYLKFFLLLFQLRKFNFKIFYEIMMFGQNYLFTINENLLVFMQFLKDMFYLTFKIGLIFKMGKTILLLYHPTKSI